MKRMPLLLICVAAALSARDARAQEALDLILPQGQQRIRVEIALEGDSPTAKWSAFLDRWFDYFDTDGDGVLSPDEAKRLFPLPVPDAKSVLFDFKRADADGDMKISRAELKEFYRGAGFAPVLGIAVPVSIENLQIADALFRHLDPDAGGKLRVENLKAAAKLLRKLDENEDEFLSAVEVLSLGVTGTLKAPGRAAFQWARPLLNQPAGARIGLSLDAGAAQKSRALAIGESVRLESAGPLPRVRHDQAVLAFALSEHSPARAAGNSRQFVLAQFRGVVGNAPAIEKRQLADDPSLQVLADIFPHADRNEDGKLTLAELERFLALIEEGVRCPLVVTLTDCGRNLFYHLDQNGDGRLDLKELHGASDRVIALGVASGWTREQVPYFVQVTFQLGFAGDAFGPLPLATPARVAKNSPLPRSTQGPAWFQAMDKNGDGFLSPREFLGPLELFRQLDRDGDGLISVVEAELGDARRPKIPPKN